MTDPLIRSEHVVGSWDPDAGGWSARDFTAGPAGSAGIELPGGVEVDIDVAAPSTLVGLWVPSIPGRGMPEAAPDTMRTLVALLGEPRAAELLGMLEAGGPPRQLRTGPDGFDLVGPFGFGGSRREGVAAPLSRLALALDLTDHPAHGPLTRALASLDASVATNELADALPVDDRARTLAAAAIEQLLAVARAGDLEGEPIRGNQLIYALERVVPLLGAPIDNAVRRLIDEINDGAYDLAPDGFTDDHQQLAAHPMLHPSAAPQPSVLRLESAAPRPLGQVLDVIDVQTLPERFARDRVAARATTDSEIEVRIHGRAAEAEGWWARAYTGTDVVVAAAPLRASGRDAVARLLVPPADLRSVTVDITNAPGEPRPPAGIRAVVDAVTIGRTAARAERLSNQRAARQRWMSAAEAWDSAGDPARAGLANEYARGPRGRRDLGRVPQPLLADGVIESDA